MKRCLLPVFIIYILLFVGCNNPLSRTYSKATYDQDVQDIQQSNNTTDEDLLLLAKYIAVLKLSGKRVDGKTYEDMLDNIKKIQKNGNDQAEKEKNDEQVKRERMAPLLNVSLLEKKFSKINDKDCLVYSISFQNTSHENIKTILGNIRLADLLEKEIKKIVILLDEEVKPNSTLNKTYTFQYNHADENDQRIRSKDIVDLRVEWNPGKIIFESGKLAE